MLADRVTLEDGLLRVGGGRIPLLGGEVHFFRTDPRHWDAILGHMVDAGIPIVSSYLSWRRHEPVRGTFNFTGKVDPRLDIRGFLDRCRAYGLLVHLKPGPWICAEEPGGGLPDWLLDDRELWAIDAAGEPILGYDAPWQHPVPSYLHPRYLGNVRRWLRAIDRFLAGYFFPDGPVALVQLDNEPSYAFRDSMYGFDYNPTTIVQFRQWLLRRYRTVARIERTWDVRLADLDAAKPPRTGKRSEPTRRELDWIEFREWLIAEYLRRLRRYHESAGVDRVLFTTNFNEHPVDAVPQDGWRIARATGGTGGPDLYFVPPLDGDDVARMARMIAVGRAHDPAIAWAPEIQAGIWRTPGETVKDPQPGELEFWWRAALAFGLRGLNLYMLADRERWDQAPLGSDGRPGALWLAVGRLAELVKGVLAEASADPVLPVALYRQQVMTEHEYSRDRGRRWAPMFGELLANGRLPNVWDWRSDEPHGTRAVMVIRPDLLLPQDERRLRRFALSGGLVIAISDDGGPARAQSDVRPSLMAYALMASSVARAIETLDEAGIRSPVEVDDRGVTAVLARGRAHDLLFLIRADSAPGPVAARLPGSGYRRVTGLAGSPGRVRLDGEVIRANLPAMTVAAYRLAPIEQLRIG